MLGVAASLLLPGAASGAPSVTGEFALPPGITVGTNNEIVQGPDGNMWVTTEQNSVVRIKPDGTVQGPFPTTNSVQGITVGPDGNIWASSLVGVVKIPPANPAAADPIPLGGTFANGFGITTGPDGNMWVAGTNQLVRFSTSDPVGTQDVTAIAGLSAKGMDTGSDGLLWIADGSGRILSATATDTPTVTPYQVDGGPQDVAAGLNGQVAYVNPNDTPVEIGLITGGILQQIPIATSDPDGVAFGQDRAYWVARASTDDLMRMAPDGSRTTLGGFSNAANVGPRKIATGPGNTLWVTLDEQEKIGRVSGVAPPAITPPPPPPPTTAPETTIEKGPKRKIKTSKRRAKVKFKFSSDTAGATFECAATRKGKQPKPKPCSSPKKYKLKPGRYKFSVQASAGGLTDASPATLRFKVVAIG
jgi:streptogramin lyase